MKHIIIKTAVAGIIALGLASCTNDLHISPIDPQSSPSYDDMELLAKQYATLGVTGQKGPAGSADMSGDEGESGFFRTVFNLQELPTDECIWAWQSDQDIPALTNMAWNSSSVRVNWVFQRLAFNITLYNSYLTEMEGRTDGEYPHYIAEVRFMRALNFYYFLDLFRKAPFKTVFSTKELPTQKAGKELYDWIDQELTAIESELAPIGSFNGTDNFGRADQGAAYALHARLALNSAVYTNGQVKDYQKAIDYCDKLINSGKYALSTASKNGYSGYEQVFMGDNDYNTNAMREIIFPIRQDGVKTQSYAGATYLVSSMRISGMPYSATDNYWSCNFARQSLVQKFFPTVTDCPIATEALKNPTEEQVIAKDIATGTTTADVIAKAKDDRALFYSGCGGGIRTFTTKQITGFLNGLSIVKGDVSK